jgi:hypothetical protein
MIPAVFPDRLSWPPIEVLHTPGADRPVRMTFRGASTGDVVCVIAQTLDGTAALPPGMLVEGNLDAHVAISRDPDHPVVVQVVRTPDGTVWREATSLIQNRRVVIRLVDTDDTVLLRMVRSLRGARVSVVRSLEQRVVILIATGVALTSILLGAIGAVAYRRQQAHLDTSHAAIVHSMTAQIDRELTQLLGVLQEVVSLARPAVSGDAPIPRDALRRPSSNRASPTSSSSVPGANCARRQLAHATGWRTGRRPVGSRDARRRDLGAD